MKTYYSIIILFFAFFSQFNLLCQNLSDSLVLNLFKAKFLSKELDKLINSNNLGNFESLKDILPSDSIIYNIRIDKFNNSSINFGCFIYLGNYSIQRKSELSISTSMKIYEPLIINSKCDYYFITKKSDLVCFIQNEVDLTFDKNIINLIKLLYELDFQNNGEHLFNFEDTILDGEKNFVDNYMQTKMIIDRDDEIITIKYYTYGINHNTNGEEVTYLNIINISKSDFTLKKEIINKY